MNNITSRFRIFSGACPRVDSQKHTTESIKSILAGFILLASFVAFGLTCIAWLVAGGSIDLTAINCYW